MAAKFRKAVKGDFSRGLGHTGRYERYNGVGILQA